MSKSKNKKVTKSTEFAAVVKVIPALPAVRPVACEPPLTVIWFIAIVLEPVPSCINNIDTQT